MINSLSDAGHFWELPLLFTTGLVAGFVDAIAGGGGLITLGVKIINQNGKTVQSGEWLVLMSTKPAAE